MTSIREVVNIEAFIKDALERRAPRFTMRIGVLGKPEDQYEDGLTVALVASVHEFGAPSIKVPERSFIRSAWDRARSVYLAKISRAARLYVEEQATFTPESARERFQWRMDRIGLQVRDEVRGRIRENIPPPLSEATVQQRIRSGRASSRDGIVALIDSGQLIQSIRHEVEA